MTFVISLTPSAPNETRAHAVSTVVVVTKEGHNYGQLCEEDKEIKRAKHDEKGSSREWTLSY